MSRTSRERSAGFTMIELVVAIALMGLLLVALNTFIFSMGELWGKNNDRRLFEQHVRAVSRYLESDLRKAALPPAGTGNVSAFEPAEVRPSGAMTENLITFELAEGSRLLNWSDRPLPEVVCSLQVRERQGLYLLWHSRLEERFEDDPPREVQVSPFVTGMAYDYFDVSSRRWETSTTLKKDTQSGGYLTPQRLRLRFAFKGYTMERLLPLPSAGEGLPNF